MNPKKKKLIYGVGINDADYAIMKMEEVGCVDGKKKRKKVWECPYFRVWMHMLERCYSAKYQEKQPTYKGCSIVDEWLTFSSFRDWVETQDWEGLQLDKDILIEGNKVYSPDNCVFVTQMVNKFTTDGGGARGEWLIGVSWNKQAEKLRAQCRNPFTGKNEYLGYFDCELKAHKTWLKRKIELAHELAAIQTDSRVAKALINKYENYGSGEYTEYGEVVPLSASN